MNVEYFHRIVRCLVKDFVWIAYQWHHTHPRSLGDLLRALWPFSYTRDNGTKPNLKCSGCGRVVAGDVGQNAIEIVEGLDRKNHLHTGRYFSKTPLTCWSVAKRPSR